jgi:ubiquinone/menaquinone biosynthesis C-methylase UbiE
MNQKQVWNKIAPEWYEFRTRPSEYTLEFLKNKFGNILDLGSGAGRHLVKINKGKMWLVDFSKEMIKFAKEKSKRNKIKAEFFVSDLTKLPFKDNFFDSAIAIASLHCVEGKENREKAIKELFRVLKKGAKADIAVWNKDSKKFKNSPKEKYVKWRDKGKRYYYLFDEKEIHELFKKAGFNIKEKFIPKKNIRFIVEK